MYWWHDDPTENLFMEITTREDIGGNLQAPVAARGGRTTPGYALVETVKPGDLVVHYSSTEEAIVGISRAVGEPEPAPIFWAARGTYARKAGARPRWLSGIRVPLDDYVPLEFAVTLTALRERAADIMAVRDELSQRYPKASLYFPWTPYSGESMRTFQGYLVKLPRAVIEFIPELDRPIVALERQDTTPIRLVDVEAAEGAVGASAGKSRQQSGQGFRQDQAVKVAIEAHAMDAAIEYWTQQGEVADVHGNQSYDLMCVIGGQKKHIEVKGTTTAGDEVILTPNEVAHARKYPHVCLFIVLDIEVTRHTDGHIGSAGGSAWVLDPWRIDDGTLTPLGFKYEVPK
jgi:hypothetical protein